MTKYKSIVLNVPHASIEGLSDSNWMLGSEFFSQVKKWTDWYTDYLFSSNRHNIKMVRASLSRFIVDTERLIDDPLEERGEGNIYKKFGGIHRNLVGNEESLLNRYYNAHQQHLRNLLSPESLLIDCHSFPSCLSDDIDICIGYNEDWSKPDEETIQLFVSVFESHGYRVGINLPYSNAISPECPFHYPSIMVELNKRIYMNEETIELIPEHTEIKKCIEEIYENLLKAEPQNS